MNPYREAKVFDLLRARRQRDDTERDHHLDLQQAVFFSVSSAEARECAGFAIPHAALPSLRTIEIAAQAVRAIGSDAKTCVWKLVGESGALDSAAAALRKAGYSEIELRPRDFGNGVELLYTASTGRIRVAPVPAAAPTAESRTRVLIVDDSKTIRSLLEKILASDPTIEVVGSAEKPSDAEKLIHNLKPDVITLDIHMPEMDGITFLKSYLPRYPIPTVMISSISLEEGPLVLSALEAGAVDYVQKPSFEELKIAGPIILEKIRHARHAKIQAVRSWVPAGTKVTKKSPVNLGTDLGGSPIVAIGSSTGGTEALRQVFARFPAEIPPTLVVQHIPPVFSKAFAMRMNELFPFEVKEAVDGDVVAPNRILIAPGGTQMSLLRKGSGFVVKVDAAAGAVNRHKPSVDVLFDSVAELLGPRAFGVILTGMGSDGAKGLLRMKNAGATTFGQDEASSVVYGMPRAAHDLGAVDHQLPLDQIAPALFEALSKKKRVA
jgi:two-component system chemotaxis response regulator CheB